MRALLTFACVSLACLASASAQERSFFQLTTGNGHGFQLFDRETRRITTFLEHPYRYVAEANPQRTQGIGRRNLAHDAYFGLSQGGQHRWLSEQNGQTDVSYERESHIIHGHSSEGALAVDTYYFAPFGYQGNALVALVRVQNPGAMPAQARVVWKPNLKLGNTGGARENPADDGEIISFLGAAQPAHAIETGPGGGHALYLPIGGFDQASCGTDSALYQQFASTGKVDKVSNCSGGSQVMVLGRDLTIPAHGEAWWGAATLFLNDNPNAGNADAFRDRRAVSDMLELWRAYLGERAAKALHDDALAEHEAFRTHTAPADLSDEERALWRQSETVLRMAQIREPTQGARVNDGMMLAALPPGEWHIGWVRDASYAVAALAMTGHKEMAERGLTFFLNADPQTRGFFNHGYLEQTYRVSATRYFGNGKEEGDFNADGPNVETDGFGLVLWAAGMVMHFGCDTGFLDTLTLRGDTVYQALHEIAEDIRSNVADDLPAADASIWEVHWGRRQVFTFTAAAQVRGLFDFAHIAELHGDAETAKRMRSTAEAMRARMLSALVHEKDLSLVSHLGVADHDVHVDGSTVEALMWDLVEPEDPIFQGTLRNFSRLTTPFGGYQRLEPGLSLTGENGANLYDAAEWIFLDLRIGQAFRRAGDAATADRPLDWATRSATMNDHLLPELYDRDSGRYQGAIPMVGYGAGVWMMTQLEKHGVLPPRHDRDLSHCLAGGDDAGVAADASAPESPESDHGSDAGAQRGDAGQGTPDDTQMTRPRGSHCSLEPTARVHGACFALASSCALLWVRRRRRGRAAQA